MKLIQKRNIQLLILFLMILFGTIAGSILYALYPQWNIWNNVTFLQGIGILKEQHFYCIIAPLFWLAVVAVLGLSAAGMPLVLLVLFLRGAAIGSVLETLYTNESPLRAGMNLLLIVPYAYATSFVMLFAAREALRFSLQITDLVCEKMTEEYFSVKLYTLRFLVLFLFMTLFGILQNFLLIHFS